MRYKLIGFSTALTGSFLCAEYYYNKNKEKTIRKIFKKSGYDIEFDTVKGKMFYGRELIFTNFKCRDPDNDMDLFVERLMAKTSVFGLRNSKLFITSLNALNTSGTVKYFDESFWAFFNRFRNIKVKNLDLKFGDGDNTIDLKIDFLDTHKYGINLKNAFSFFELSGTLNQCPMRFSSVDEKKYSEFGQRYSAKSAQLKIDNMPEFIKYFVHMNLSNILLRSPRAVMFEIDTNTLLNVLLFLRVPFLFEFQDDENLQTIKNSKFKFECRLLPGRKYDLDAKVEWNNFCLPRVVSQSPKMDQFFVFLKSFFASRKNFSAQISAFQTHSLIMKSDKDKEVLAFFKIVNTIFASSLEDIFSNE